MAKRMIEKPPARAAVQKPKRPGRGLAQKVRRPRRERRASLRLGKLAGEGGHAVGAGVQHARRIVEAGLGLGDLGDLGEHGEPLLGDPGRGGWIEPARAILERIEPVARKRSARDKLRELDLFRREPLDRMSKKCGDASGHGVPLPDRAANRNQTRKASVSMSDPTAASRRASNGEKERGKPPYHLAPWLAMAAMAAATLWPRRKRLVEAI